MLARTGYVVRTISPPELEARGGIGSDDALVVDAACGSVVPFIARMTQRPPILILAHSVDVEVAELCACQWLRCVVLRSPVQSDELDRALDMLGEWGRSRRS